MNRGMTRASLGIRLAVSLILSIAAAFLASAGNAASPNLDVAGVKIGMSLTDAVAALKADNPKFYINVVSHQWDGLSAPVHPFVLAQSTGDLPGDSEDFSLLVTTAPGPEQVWGINRLCGYRADNRPSTANVVAALRKKYGSENVPPGQSLQTQNLAWVYDESGNPLPEDKARQVLANCGNMLQTHFGNNDDPASYREIQTGNYAPQDCGQFILIKANVQSTLLTPGSSDYVAYSLDVQMTHYSMYRTAVQATRAVVAAAAQASQKNAAQDANQRGAPKL
jgi:hypothetical protein